MKNKNHWIIAIAAVVSVLVGAKAWCGQGGKLSVAVTEPDIEAIVKVVGGDQVDTFTLFKGCILRKDLMVESAVRGRLLKADAVVWTGFFNESAAIHDSVRLLDKAEARPMKQRPVWINVSLGAKRVNVPMSTCDAYVEISFMYGNPFFWLNPANAPVMARNVAEGLAEMRPDKKAYFLANAEAFDRQIKADISRWQAALKPLSGLRVFTAQCGWQNFSQIGGPTFAACTEKPGELPSPQTLVEHVKKMKVQVVIVDPNTPPEYGRAFRAGTKAKVIEVPSSIEDIPGAKTYQALFDNMVKALKDAAKT